MVRKVNAGPGNAPSPNNDVIAGVSFILATFILTLFDTLLVGWRPDLNYSANFELLLMLPTTSLALPMTVGLAAFLAAYLRRRITGINGPKWVSSTVADLIIAAPVLVGVPALFSGPSIVVHQMRVPAVIATCALALSGVIILRISVVKLVRTLRSRSAKQRLLAMGATVTVGLLIAILFGWLTRAILPGLYLEFHRSITLAAIAILGAAFYVLTTLRGRSPSRKRFLWVAVSLAMLSWPVGAYLSLSAPLGRQLLVEHSSFSGPFLGATFSAQHRYLWSWLRTPRSTDATVQPLGFSRVSFDSNSKKRNVLLVTVDALRGDTLDRGDPLANSTPSLRALAASSLSFTRAYAPANYTPYSISAFVLGRVPGPSAKPQMQDCISSPFNGAGYRTEFFFTSHEYASLERTPLWPLASRGFFFQNYHPKYEDVDHLLAKVERVLDTPGAPLFVWAHLSDVHAPFMMRGNPNSRASRYPDNYAGQLEYLDKPLAQFIEQQRNKHPELVWAVASDHGESLGERGIRFHGSNLYEEQIRVPLLMGGPGVGRGRVEGPVGTSRLGATLLSLAGGNLDPSLETLPLLPSADTSPTGPVLLVGRTNLCGLVDGPWKLVADGQNGVAHLFNMVDDPNEMKNLISTESQRAEKMLTLTIEMGCPFKMGSVVF